VGARAASGFGAYALTPTYGDGNASNPAARSKLGFGAASHQPTGARFR